MSTLSGHEVKVSAPSPQKPITLGRSGRRIGVALLPLIGVALTLVLVAVTSLAWIQATGTLLLRLQYTAVAAAGVVFASILHTWNLLGWRF